VVLDLVGEQRSDLERALEHPGGEVGDARVADPALLLELAQRLDRVLERGRVARPVQQEQVDVVGVQLAQRVLGGALQPPRLRVGRTDLRRDEDVAAVDAAGGDAGRHLGLVAVRARGVYVPVPDLERVAHALGRFTAPQLPGAEPDPRDLGPLDGQHGVLSSQVAHAPGLPAIPL
jgi:hypothetical protein